MQDVTLHGKQIVFIVFCGYELLIESVTYELCDEKFEVIVIVLCALG